MPRAGNRDAISVAIGVKVHRDKLVVVSNIQCPIGERWMAPDYWPRASSIGGVGRFYYLCSSFFAVFPGSHLSYDELSILI
ncbi:MAG: hypothetical protein CMI15_15150 [Opitutaceae bacterium]|nr:hypothetical protein [Opitutaceae bacterium]